MTECAHTPAFVEILITLAIVSLICVRICQFDLAERRIPNKLVLALIACAAVMTVAHAFLTGDASPVLARAGERVCEACAMTVSLVAIESLWRCLAHRHGMGYGDIKLIGAFTLFVGPIGELLAIMIACILAVIVEVPSGRTAFPFAPYLCAGSMLVLVAEVVILFS